MNMKKTVHRDLVFTAAEVRDAITYMLENRDHPVPGKDATDVVFRLGENGASLAWTEVSGQ